MHWKFPHPEKKLGRTTWQKPAIAVGKPMLL